jgi:hypothetical protein
MNAQLGLDRCLSFINCQLQPLSGVALPANGHSRTAVTISRQAGTDGHAVAASLAELLQAHSPAEECPWTIFDRNLVEQVLQDHKLPNRLARFMPEDRISEIADTMDELFGLHPPSWTLVRQTADTVLRLATLGNVILIGRGAAVITAKLTHVFHVRLVGSLEKRVKHFQEVNQLNAKEALERVREADLGRQRYLKKYFNRDIDDPLLYHLVINTDLVPHDQAVRMIGEALLKKVAGVRRNN